jgi:hypothetical protein
MITRSRTLAATAALGLAGAAVALTIGAADAAPVTTTFEYSGAAEEFPVPEGICQVTASRARPVAGRRRRSRPRPVRC